MTTTLTLFLAFGEADAQVLHFDLNCCIVPELFKSSYISSSDFVQNDHRSARNLMVIARMPEDRSKTFKNN